MEKSKTNKSENLRYERKFVFEGTNIKDVVTLIKLNNALFSEIYEERTVNSMYFDTHGFQLYSENVSGSSERSKVRVRWYGDNIGLMHDSKLEIKSKSGNIGDKNTFDLGNFRTHDFYDNYGRYVNSDQIDPNHQFFLKTLAPVLIISYTRRYFMSADKAFRITLDYNLNFYDIRTSLNKRKKILSNISVMELKYKSKDDDRAAYITNQFPYRYSKCSKYVIGLESIFN